MVFHRKLSLKELFEAVELPQMHSPNTGKNLNREQLQIVTK